jgi:citrate/tricarballylate utilization protein
VLPHHIMVALFTVVSLFVVAALVAACRHFWRDTDTSRHLNGGAASSGSRPLWTALGDALTLRHLHGAGADCTDAEESRGPWRRRFHHCTFYGFALCFASTSVAALYHVGFGWRAPYAYTSVPVILGTIGGIGLLVGPAGLLALRQSRDEALSDPAQRGLDLSFLVMLLLTSVTGLALLVLRDGRTMPALLTIHLASVFALFVMLPYGKFVHGIYRTAALVQFAAEQQRHIVNPAKQ